MSAFFPRTAHLLRLLSLFIGISASQQASGWKINVPQRVTAVEGSCVVVPCLTRPHSRVIWYQYHNIHYPVVYDGHKPQMVEDQFRGRTSVPGKAEEGNCTLMIDNVKRADDNLRIYVWINPDSTTSEKFHHQTVTITVEKAKTPRISIQSQIVDGQVFQANCSVYYSCPVSPPSLHWSTSPSLKNFTIKAFVKEVQGRWLYTETLNGLATYAMNKGKMTCSAQFETSTNKQQITFNVLYKPVTVNLLLEKTSVMEGSSVVIECAANCNPQPHTYSWLRRQTVHEITVNSTQRKMSFYNVTRDTSFSCIAHNDLGRRQSKWSELDVQYAPEILPESSCSHVGEVVKCICKATASPQAAIYWNIDGNNDLPYSFSFVSSQKHVTLGEISVPATNQSNISCTATNSIGSNTKLLSVDILPKTLSLHVWLSVFIPLGAVLLFGCAVFIYRKYSMVRRQSVLHVQPGGESNSPQRTQDEDIPLSTDKPESNPEQDRLSCVYDNDLVEEMMSARAQCHNRRARENKPQPPKKVARGSMDIYINC